MPTISAAGASRSGNESHHLRQVAESFGWDAERYDRTRPRYPTALLDRIIAASPGHEILDVGIGTGIAARQFRAAGGTVLGVEPDARMAAFARGIGFEVEVATFEAWAPAGRSFDAVIAGQAWHWVDPVAGAAKAAQVLRPGGRLALFWNLGQPPPEATEAFGAVYRRVVPDALAARAYRGAPPAPQENPMFATAADGIRRSGGFGEPEQWQVDWEQPYTRDEWLDQVPTQGDHSQFPPEKLAAVLVGIGSAIDHMGGAFTMRYTTVAVTAARTAA